MKKGKIITFEGIDQSGKETQSKLIMNKLREEGYRIGYTYFPNYETNIGKELTNFLEGKVEYSHYVTQLLFAANRYEMLADLNKLLEENDFLIIDRYISSGVIYGCVNGLDYHWTKTIEGNLPQEDLTILLDISSQVSRSRKSESTRDVYEKKYEFLDKVREAYLKMAKDNSWIIIDADDTIENVHHEVWEKLKEKM